MTAPIVYPPIEAILEAHGKMLERYGGAGGIRDRGAIEAALPRPEQLRADADVAPGIAACAAAIGLGLARIHHPFVDGNKRIAFFAVVATLRMNGLTLDVAEHEAASVMEQVAEGSLDEAGFVAWLEGNSRSRDEWGAQPFSPDGDGPVSPNLP